MVILINIIFVCLLSLLHLFLLGCFNLFALLTISVCRARRRAPERASANQLARSRGLSTLETRARRRVQFALGGRPGGWFRRSGRAARSRQRTPGRMPLAPAFELHQPRLEQPADHATRRFLRAPDLGLDLGEGYRPGLQCHDAAGDEDDG